METAYTCCFFLQEPINPIKEMSRDKNCLKFFERVLHQLYFKELAHSQGKPDLFRLKDKSKVNHPFVYFIKCSRLHYKKF